MGSPLAGGSSGGTIEIEVRGSEEGARGVLHDTYVHGVAELLVDRLVGGPGGGEALEGDTLETCCLTWGESSPDTASRHLRTEDARLRDRHERRQVGRRLHPDPGRAEVG